ncbi:hypothetical protein ACFW04_014733 [Cataglyphis niger]
MTTVGFTQINLHHSKSASAVLARSMAVVYRGCIRNIAACRRFLKSPIELNPRAAIAVKRLEAHLMPEFCSRDVAAIVLMEYYQAKELPLIMGCDANAHYMVWGFWSMMATDLEILNRDNEPTFQKVLRCEILDLTLCSRNLVLEIVGWQVSSKLFLSDYRHIDLRLANMRSKAIFRRNPRTDLDLFREDLSTGLCGFPKRHGTGAEVELCVDHLQRALMGSLEKNCPVRAAPSKREGRRLRTRRAWNRTRNTDQRERESWRRFCESMKEIPEASRLCKILTRNPDSNLQSIRLPGWGRFRRTMSVLWIGWNFSGAPTREARADQRAAHADSESLFCFGIHSQGMVAGEGIHTQILSERCCFRATSAAWKHAYKIIFSTETVLHSLVFQIERDLIEGGYAVRIILDIEGVFNNVFNFTSHEVLFVGKQRCTAAFQTSWSNG